MASSCLCGVKVLVCCGCRKLVAGSTNCVRPCCRRRLSTTCGDAVTGRPVQSISAKISGSGRRPPGAETQNSHITSRTRRARGGWTRLARTTLRSLAVVATGPGGSPASESPGGSVHQRSIVRIGVPLAVAALALSACGSRGDSGTPSGGSTGGARPRPPRSASSPRSPVTCRPSARASSTPSSWPSSRPTTPTRSPAGRSRSSSVDDEAKADVGKNAATKLAADDQVIGVVGDLNSSVSQQTQPIFAAANITQISPANTNPSLTIGADAAAPKRAYKTYFRTCTTDAVQGPFAAQYLLGAGHQERRDDPRQEGLRPGSRRRVHHRVQEGRRHRRRGRDDQPRRVELPGRRVQGRPVQAAGRLLRR